MAEDGLLRDTGNIIPEEDRPDGPAAPDTGNVAGPDLATSNLPSLEEWMAGAEEDDDRPPYIGVPEGFVAEDARMEHPSKPLVDIAPRFRAGAELEYFMNLRPADRVKLQETLADAGVLSTYRAGMFDQATGNAIGTVMAWANVSGKTFSEALTEFTAKSEDIKSQDISGFSHRPYTPPSWDELAQIAREGIEQQLGRKLKDWEVEMAAEKLGSLHRAEFENDVIEARASRNAQIAAAEEGTDQAVGEIEAGVQDHKAAYRAWFNEKFGDELERQADVEESQQQQARTSRVTSVIKNIL